MTAAFFVWWSNMPWWGWGLFSIGILSIIFSIIGARTRRRDVELNSKICEHCRGVIPITATKCMHCGSVQSANKKSIRTIQQENVAHNPNKMNPSIAFMTMVGVFVFFLGVVLLFTSSVVLGILLVAAGLFLTVYGVRRTIREQKSDNASEASIKPQPTPDIEPPKPIATVSPQPSTMAVQRQTVGKPSGDFGITRCPYCAKEIEVDAKACSNCGKVLIQPTKAEQTESSPSEEKKCPYCAEMIKAEAVVCRYCGRDLGQSVQESTASQTCVITHDILIDGSMAFSKGDHVEIESVSPDPNRPEYKYVVLAKTRGKRYRLSDNDLSMS